MNTKTLARFQRQARSFVSVAFLYLISCLSLHAASMLKFVTSDQGIVAKKGGIYNAYLTLAAPADPQTLKVMSGSQDLTSFFNVSSCFSVPCKVSATLMPAHGSNPGWNRLRATVKSKTGAADMAALKFYSPGGLSDPTTGYAPPNIVQVTQKGADIKVLAPTPVDIPSCSQIHVVVLDRNDLTYEASQDKCLADTDVAGFLQYLGQGDLVFALTSASGSTGNADFTAIGGTNFNGKPVTGYSIVGYGHASTGTAFEAWQQANDDGTHPKAINGNLVNITCDQVPACTDSNDSLYAFIAANAQAFAIVPGAEGSAGNPGMPTIYVGNVQNVTFNDGAIPNQKRPANSITGKDLFSSVAYTPNWSGNSLSVGAAGGFWLLILNRSDLTVYNSLVYVTNCACASADTEQAQMAQLAIDLNTSDPNYLHLLTTVGIPFSTKVDPTPLLAQFAQIGVSPYALQGIVPDQLGTVAKPGFSLVAYSPTASNSKLYSSSANAQQNESGALLGVFAQQRTAYYEAISVAPFNVITLPYDHTADDFLRAGLSHAIATTSPVAWPFSDTLGGRNAYAYLSNVLVSSKFGVCTGDNCTCVFDVNTCHDIRFFYTSSEVEKLYGEGLQPGGIVYPGDTVAQQNGFTRNDFDNVQNQLSTEFNYLSSVITYRDSVASINNDATQNVGIALSAAGNEVAAGLNKAMGNTNLPAPETSAIHLSSDMFNTEAGMASTVGPLAALEDPASEIAALLGPASGVFWTVSALLAFVADAQSDPSVPPPDPYVVRLQQLISDNNNTASEFASEFNKGLISGSGIYFDGIVSDWFRLQSVALLSTNPKAKGWFSEDFGDTQSTYVGTLTANARTNLYMQTVPQYFQSMTFQGIASGYWRTVRGYSLDVLGADFVSYYMKGWFNIDGWDGPDPYGPNLEPSDLTSYSWANRTAPGANSYCEDFTFFVTPGTTGTNGSTWPNDFGSALFSRPVTDDGLTGLNLDRNWFYDTQGIKPFPAHKPNPASPWVVNGNKTTAGGPDYWNCGHYPQPWDAVQPVFSGLSASATIKQGTDLVLLSGYFSVNGAAVSATINNATYQAQTDPADGSFQINFITREIPGSTTPYVITYSYAGSTGNLPASDTSTTLTVISTETEVSILGVPAAATYGDTITITAKVTSPAGTPSGRVQFYDNGVQIGTGTLDGNGQAQYTPLTMTAGKHEIYAIYPAQDPYLSGTSLPVYLEIAQVQLQFGPLSPASPTAPYLAPSVQISGKLLSTATPPLLPPAGETVSVEIGGSTQSATLDANGNFPITFALPSLQAGTYPITFTYGGDANFVKISGQVGTLRITLPTQLALTFTSDISSGNTVLVGHDVIFTAQFINTSGTPTGTVTFLDGTTTLQEVAIGKDGTASYKTNSLAVGSHTITANYGGDTTYIGSTASLPLLVKIPTAFSQLSTVSLPAGASPATFSGVISGPGPVYPIPAEGVTVSIQGGLSNTGKPDAAGNFKIAVATPDLAPGTYSITYTYGGNSELYPATQTAQTLTITSLPTSTELRGSSDSGVDGIALVGHNVTFTATVSSSKGTPPGTVTFQDADTTTLGSAPVGNDGTASYTTNSLAIGPHHITASYSGGGNYRSSVSKVLPQSVVAPASFSQLSSPSVPVGTPTVTFTGYILGPGPTYPNRISPVSVSVGGVTGSDLPIADTGHFSITIDTSQFAAGSYPVHYSFPGDSKLFSATDDSTVLTVNPLVTTTTTVVSSLGNAPYGKTVTFTATVTGAGSIGTVAFLDGQTTLATVPLTGGTASFATATLPAGTHQMTAVYSGAPGIVGSTSPEITQSITALTPVFSGLTPAPSADEGTSIQLSGVVSSAPVSGSVLKLTDVNNQGLGGALFSYDASGVSTDSATFSTWINTTAKTNQVIFTAANSHPYLFLENDQLKLVWDGAGPATPGWVSTDTTPVSDGTWHHIAVTFDQGKITFYKDGVATNDSFMVTTPGNADAPVNFGGSTAHLWSFVGEMWNSKVWAKALSASDIQGDMFAVYDVAVPDGLKLMSYVDPSTNTFINRVSGAAATISNGQLVMDSLPSYFPAMNEQVSIKIEDVTTPATIGLRGAFTANVDVSKLAVGSHSITYQFDGDSAFASGSDISTTLTIKKVAASTTTVVSSSAPSPDYGASVTFTATVSSTAGTPTGTVAFYDNNTTLLGTGSLQDGQATLQINTLPAGNHSITGVYGGDNTDFAKSTSLPFPQTVNKGTPVFVVLPNPDPITAGTSRVQLNNGKVLVGTLVPSGQLTITIDAGSDSPTIGPDGSFSGSVDTSSLQPGSYAIVYSIPATDNYNGVMDSSTRLTVQAASPTHTTVLSSMNPAPLGTSITFTATVTGSGTPTGTVSFYDNDGATLLGQQPLISGSASYSTSSLAAGDHNITAVYSGGAGFSGSTSVVLPQRISGQIQTTLTVSASPNPGFDGDTIILTATVTQSGAMPTGNVTFSEPLGPNNVIYYGNAFLVNGVATLTVTPTSTPTFTVGTHTLYGTYSGDVNYTPATSAPYPFEMKANQ